MHRIDSATARANQNGEGKFGFNDNSDLPNQDPTYFTPEWANAVQEEIANTIERLGVDLDKNDNKQLSEALIEYFANKKTFDDKVTDFESRIAELEGRTYEDTQIGELFWTTEHFVTAEEVAEYKGYGTWQRALQGRVPVGFSDNPSDDEKFRTHGAEYGESEVILDISQMPEHKHSNSDVFNKFSSLATESGKESQGSGDYQHTAEEYSTGDMTPTDWEAATEQLVGGADPVSLLQPSITIDCWERTA